MDGQRNFEREADQEMGKSSDISEDAQKAMRGLLLVAKVKVEKEKIEKSLANFEHLAKSRVKFYGRLENIIKFMIFVPFALALWRFFDPNERRSSWATTLLYFNMISMLSLGLVAWLVNVRDVRREATK